MESVRHQKQPQVEFLRPGAILFTGLSGAGKTTLSQAIKAKLDLLIQDRKVVIFDGGEIRGGLNKNLGYEAEDVTENIRRIAEMSKLFIQAGMLVILAVITPYSKDRLYAKLLHSECNMDFLICHISAPLHVCEARDVQGLYKKARAGEITMFNGIDEPYEIPVNPDLNVRTHELSVEESIEVVLAKLHQNGNIRDNRGGRISESLYKYPSEEENINFEKLLSIEIDSDQARYLHALGQGWAYPLSGFMNEMQLLEALQMKTVTLQGKLHLFPIPITQSVTAEQLDLLKNEKQVALKCPTMCQETLAVIENPVFFENRKEEVCARAFGTQSLTDFKDQKVFAQGDFLITGARTRFLSELRMNDGWDQFRLSPGKIQELVREKRGDCLFAFIASNFIHNGHLMFLNEVREDLLKAGFENPLLLLCLEESSRNPGELDLDLRIKQSQAIFKDGMIKEDHVIQVILPSLIYCSEFSKMMWHASSLVQAGITHFIVGSEVPDISGTASLEKAKVIQSQQLNILSSNRSLLNNIELLPFKTTAFNKYKQNWEFVENDQDLEDLEVISRKKITEMARTQSEWNENVMGKHSWQVVGQSKNNSQAECGYESQLKERTLDGDR